MENKLKAADNAAAANDLLAKALTEEPEVVPAKIIAPSSTQVDLPGGYVTTAGEVIKSGEVRELNGRDEEAILRAGGSTKVFTTILSRGVTMIGDKKATEDILDNLLVGDRDALLLGIYRATFGDTADLRGWCTSCGNPQDVSVDINTDIKSKVLVDPVNDAVFTVRGKKDEFLVALPTGATQKKVMAVAEASPAEQMTALLEQTVLQINGRPVLAKAQVQDLGLVDRRAIANEINDRNPGPQFDDLSVPCPNCEGEVQVPISIGALFRF